MSEPITVLKETDIQAIALMREQAQSGEIGYHQIYSHLRTLLVDDYAVAENNPTILWLDGATEANAGRGMYSAMIRAYSNTQGFQQMWSTYLSNTAKYLTQLPKYQTII